MPSVATRGARVDRSTWEAPHASSRDPARARACSAARSSLVLSCVGSPFVTARASAQAVYGSIAGTVTDSTAPCCRASPSRSPASSARRPTPSSPTPAGVYSQGAAAARALRGEGRAEGFKPAVVPTCRRRRRRADARSTSRWRSGRSPRASTVTGGQPAAQDRPRRRGDDVRAREQLTELPVLDRNFTKFVLLTPGTQQLAGTTRRARTRRARSRHGQRPALQRHRLPARRHREPRSDPRHHRHQPDARVDRREKITSQNYDAEFGQATRASCPCRPSRARNSFHGSAFEFYQSDEFQARNPFTQSSANPLTGKFLPETEQAPVRRLDRRPDRQEQVVLLRRLPGPRDTEGGSRLLTVPTAAARTRRPERVRRQHLDPLPARRPTRTAVRRQRDPDGPAVAAGAGASWT